MQAHAIGRCYYLGTRQAAPPAGFTTDRRDRPMTPLAQRFDPYQAWPRIAMANGRNTYLLASFPASQLVGVVMGLIPFCLPGASGLHALFTILLHAGLMAGVLSPIRATGCLLLSRMACWPWVAVRNTSA